MRPAVVGVILAVVLAVGSQAPALALPDASTCHARSDQDCACITTAKANAMIAEAEAARATGVRPCVDDASSTTEHVVSVVAGVLSTIVLWVLAELVL